MNTKPIYPYGTIGAKDARELTNGSIYDCIRHAAKRGKNYICGDKEVLSDEIIAELQVLGYNVELMDDYIIIRW